MTSIDPAVSAVLNVAFEQIEASAFTALAEVPTRLQMALRDATTPHERMQLAAARRHLLEHRTKLARSFGHALRSRVQRELRASAAGPARRPAAPATDPLSAVMIAWAMDYAIDGLTPDGNVARLLSRHTHPTLTKAMQGCQERIVQALQAQRSDPLRQGEPDTATLREQAGLLDLLMRGESPPGAALSADAMAPGGDSDGKLTQVVRALSEKISQDIDESLRAEALPAASGAAAAPNLIRKHRAALEQAASVPTDRLMIGIVVDLFDAVIADKQVPPPIAVVLARLQLPVLRVAMRDPAFFASNTHPVRRFVDRVATLGSARDDLDSEAGAAWLGRVEALVQQIAQGEFQQVALYEQKLRELEQVTVEQAQAEVEASPAAAALHAKEAEWQRLGRQSAALRSGLAALPSPLSLPPFVQDFLAQPWCQTIASCLAADGAETEASTRWRRSAVELATSVLPKRSADERRNFVASLRGLMTSLNDGLDLIHWPAGERSVFFDRLMAAHAGSMRATPLPDAEHAALLSGLTRLLTEPASATDETAASTPVVLAPHLEQRFSAEQAERVGLVREQDVAWAEAAPAVQGLSATPVVQAAPMPASPCTQFEVGLSYRLLLETQWQAIRLGYMSPGRNFFMFSHGSKQRRSISMTARMVDRLHADRRFAVAETAPLLDRATAQMRARVIG